MNEGQELREAADALSKDMLDGALARAYAQDSDSFATPFDLSGQTVGRYKLLEKIGEGGFGVVYMAEQREPIKRRVALKIIKSGMDTKQVTARFEAERQALAMMDHENIARALDAGATEQGRPYFVMELVRGIPVTEFCDRNRLKTEERLELFVSICNAVQHAHQKGVIHRDIKPNNVLITLRDGMSVPKVIDFGIAKATQSQLTDKTVFTRFGQFIGTPAYMSPEQAEMTEVDVDTRSDIYSLGVLLYELLTGNTPIDHEKLKNVGYSDVLKLICKQDPPKPSSRFSHSGEAMATISENRSTAPNKLTQMLRGDLDWIAMKALDKDRNRRYGTVSDLAKDVLRHLDGNPVLARPATSLYLARKLIRKHFLGIAVASLLIISMVVAIVGTSIGLIQARSARIRADAKADEARSSAFAAEQASAEALRQTYRANTNAGAVARAAHQPFVARQCLLAAPTHLRGWEWYYLMSQLDQCTAVTQSPESIKDLQISHDGKTYFTLEKKTACTVRQWSTNSHALQRTICELPSITDFVFTHDDQRLVTFDGQNKLEVRDITKGETLITVDLDGAKPWTSFDVSPDGSVCVLSWPEGFSVIDLQTGKVQRATSLASSISVLSFHPDGQRIFTGGFDGKVATIDLKTLELQQSWDDHRNRVTSLNFDPSGDQLVSASIEGNIHVWNISANKSIKLENLTGHAGSVSEASFSPNGLYLASVGVDRTIRVWEVDNWELVTVYSHHNHQPNELEFLSDSEQLITSDAKGMRCEWNVVAHETIVLRNHTGYVYPVAFSQDGKYIASGGWDGHFSEPDCVRIWDASTGDQITTFDGNVCYALAFSPHENSIAISVQPRDGEPELRIIDLQTGKARTIDTIDGKVVSLAFDPGGRSLVTASLGGVIQITDLAKNEILKRQMVGTWDFEKPVAVDWSSDARFIAVANSALGSDGVEGTITIWNAKNFEMLREWSAWRQSSAFSQKTNKCHQRPITSIQFSPDDQHLVTSSVDGTLRIWDVETGEQIGLLVGHGNEVFCGSYSPDGKRIASGGRDNRIRIWETESYQQVASLEGHEDYVYSVDWSPDGKQLISASGDKTVRIWTTQPISSRLDHRLERVKLYDKWKPIVTRLFEKHRDRDQVTDEIKTGYAPTVREIEIVEQLVMQTAVSDDVIFEQKSP